MRSTWAQRLCLTMAAVMGLSMVLPQGLPQQSGPSEFPLAGLWEVLTTRPAWSLDQPIAPHRSIPDTAFAGQVAANAMPANAGSGKPRGKGAGELDAFAPLTAAQPGQTTTPGVGPGFNEKTSKRIEPASTKSADFFTNPDGSVTQRISSRPVNYRAADGKWRPIDSTLVRDGDRWRPSASGVQVSLAGNRTATGIPMLGSEPGQPGPMRDELGMVSLPDGQELGFGLSGASGVRPVVTGSQATYSEILPGVDIELIAFGPGLKNTLILNTRPAANSWVFPLRLKGLRAVLTARGDIELLDNKGAVAARIPHGYMQDAKFLQNEGDFVKSDAVTYELITLPGKRQALRVTADRAWLDAAERVYPIRIDPTTLVSTDGDVNIDPDPNTHAAVQNGDSIAVGWDGDWVGSPSRQDFKISFISFGDFNAATNEHVNLSGKRVDWAQLNLFHTWASSCNATRSIFVHPVTADWTVAGLEDSSSFPQPYPAIAEMYIGDNRPACTNTSGNRSVGTPVSVVLNDISIIRAWAQGLAPAARGFALTAAEGDSAAFKRFTSENYAGGAYQPSLYVTYRDDTKPQIDDQYPANGYAAPSLTPELLASASDAEGDPLSYNFKIYDGLTKLAESGRTSNRSWTVPAGHLQWSKNYTWTVTVDDGAGAIAESKWHVITPVPPQPLITSRLSQNGGKGIEPSVGNYTTSAIDADIATVGPPLRIERHYNSRDSRVGSFGAGWSSLFDAKIVHGPSDPAGNLMWVTVTYPDGQDVVFGRRPDNTYVPPPGRFATLRDLGTGKWELVDKQGMKYSFQKRSDTPASVSKIASIEDPSGRALVLTYVSVPYYCGPDLCYALRPATVQSRFYQYDAAGARVADRAGRQLSISWVGGSRVTAVTTELADPADTNSSSRWTYSYSGTTLTSVCPPASTTCTRYDYTANWLYPTAAQDASPHSYLRLNDATGPAAKGEPTDNTENVTGVYHNVVLGQTGPTGSLATAAKFKGASDPSWVELANRPVLKSGYQTVSMWFKAPPGSTGVLLSSSQTAIGTTLTGWNPLLYIGTDGKLRGQMWAGPNNWAPMASGAVVNNDAWHHAALTIAGNTQTLYLDGVAVGTLAGTVVDFGQKYFYLGAGPWRDWPYFGGGDYGYFTGAISDFAVHATPLTGGQIGALRNAGAAPASMLSKITSTSGNVRAEITYDNTGIVSQLIDENRGTWKISPASISGTDSIYAASVLGGAPVDYWRLGDTGTPTTAKNEVTGYPATLSEVALGVAGPFQLTNARTAAKFNGGSSYMELPSRDIPATGPDSISMWFKLDAGQSGVLYGYQAGALSNPDAVPGWVPALYVDTTGILRGRLWSETHSGMVSPARVDDGQWHHVALTGSQDRQTLYLDGKSLGGHTSPRVVFGATKAYIGAGKWENWTNVSGKNGYWPGSIAEVAIYRSELNSGDIAAQFSAYQKSSGGPTRTVSVTDPYHASVTDPRVTTYRYDAAHGRRLIEKIDPLSNKTTYGYDSGGFLRSVVDPNGSMTVTGHDVRGNVVSQSTCQNQDVDRCTTSYSTFYPDDSTAVLTPDPRNDQVLTTRGDGSVSASDNTYLTTYTYDAKGNRTAIIDPLGRRTLIGYTDAASGVPGGLADHVVKPNGGESFVTYNALGDAIGSCDPAGLRVEKVYDGHGRVTRQTTAGQVTTYAYDKAARVVTQTDPPSTDRVTGAAHTKVTTTVYTDNGSVKETTESDATGSDTSRITRLTYNTIDKLETVTDPKSGVQRLEYDVMGQVIRVTDQEGVVKEVTYDELGRQSKTTILNFTGDPNSPIAPVTKTLEQRQYDPAGRLVAVIDAENMWTKHTYTNNGLLTRTERRYTENGAVKYVAESIEYDRAGQVTARITNDGATRTEFKRDPAGRLTEQLLDPNGLARKATYTLTPDDNVRTLTISDAGAVAQTIDSTFDLAGRKVSETVRGSGGSSTRPAAWWALDNNTGTTTLDSTINGRTASTQGNVQWLGDGAANLQGGHLATAGPVLDTTQSFTVSAWAKPVAGAPIGTIVGQDHNWRSGFELYYSGANSWGFVKPYGDGNWGATWAGGAGGAAGEWAHVVAVYDGAAGVARMYVNGALTDTQSAIAGEGAAGPLTIGRGKYEGAATQFFNGQVDNVQVYQRAASSAEVSGLYTKGRAGGSLDQDVTRSWAYDSLRRMTAETDPNGNITRYGYDAANRMVETQFPPITAEEHGATAYSVTPVNLLGFNVFGELVRSQDPKLRIVTYRRDELGRVDQTRLPIDNGLEPIIGTAYDKVNRVISQTDPLGRVTTVKYDQLGRVSKVTTPNTGATTYTYDMLGRPLTQTDAFGAQTWAEYDLVSRQTSSTQVVRQPTTTQNKTTLEYAQHGSPIRVKAPSGTTVEYGYNAAVETTWSKSPSGHFTDYQYDFAGRPTWTFSPIGAAEKTEYDALGRPVTHRLYVPGASRATTTGAQIDSEWAAYDRNGNVTTTTDFNGVSRNFGYNANGLLTSQYEPVATGRSITTTFGYDATGAPTRFTDGRGNQFWTTYNKWGLAASQIEPATTAYPNLADRTFSTTYDVAGRVVTQTSPGAVTTAYTYETGKDLLAKLSGSGAEAATSDRTFTYDAVGRVKSVTASGVSNALSYNDRGQVLSTTGSSFTYNVDGQLTKRTDAAGETSYGYGNGLLTSISNSSTGVQESLTYNPLGQLDAITFSAGDVRRFGYDVRHRLQTDELKTSGGASVAKITYGWDDNSNETSKDTVGFGATVDNDYTYDWANRLMSWKANGTTIAYDYDNSGNRIKSGAKTFDYNQRNQLNTGNGTSYRYTARGTLRETQTGTVVLGTFSDAFGQVIKQHHTQTAFSEYAYDGLGRAVKAGFSYSGLGNDLAADGTALYTRGPAGGLVGVKQGATGVYAWTDLHSDVVGQFAGAATVLGGSAVYDPLGKVVSTASMLGNLGYQSGWTDLATGRVNMHARWYNPDTGQFDSRDSYSMSPTPNSVAGNKYAYTGQNPLTRTDPSGHMYDSHDRHDGPCPWILCPEAYPTDNTKRTGDPAIDCGKSRSKCFVQGVLGALGEVFSILDTISAITELGKRILDEGLGVGVEALKKAWHEAEDEAAVWRKKIQMLGIDYLRAWLGGWACVVVGGCKGLNDCFGDGEGACSYHAGQLVGQAIMALLSDGSSAVAAKIFGFIKGKIKIPGNGKGDDNDPDKKDPDNPEEQDKDGGGPGEHNLPPEERTPKPETPKTPEPTPPPKTPNDNDNDGNNSGPSCSTAFALPTDTHSFDPSTKVLMADGSTKAIEDVEVGDEVAATDPSTGDTTAQPVTVLHENLDTDLTDVTVSTEPASTSDDVGEGKGDRSTRGPTTTVLHTTQHHPFWDVTTHSWIDAGELASGRSTLVGPDGQIQYVTGVRNFVGSATMNDLTVGTVHTYYVLAAEDPVLVHNNDPLECPIAGLTVPTKSLITPSVVYRSDLRAPSVVESVGFTSRGTTTDLMAYVLNNNVRAAWVSTSKKEELAAYFPVGKQNRGRARWVYEIRNPGVGIDVNLALGAWFRFMNDRSSEREVIFPQIDPSTIAGARLWQWGMPTGEVWTNPGFNQ